MEPQFQSEQSVSLDPSTKWNRSAYIGFCVSLLAALFFSNLLQIPYLSQYYTYWGIYAVASMSEILAFIMPAIYFLIFNYVIYLLAGKNQGFRKGLRKGFYLAILVVVRPFFLVRFRFF